MMSTLLYLTLGAQAPVAEPDRSDGSPNAGEVVAALRERNARLNSLTCSYTLETIPADGFVRSRAQARGATPEDVRSQFTSSMRATLREDRTGAFVLEETRGELQGGGTARRVLANDLKHTYILSGAIEDGEIEAAALELDGPIQRSYEADATVRRALGDTVLPLEQIGYHQSKPLFAQIESAALSELLPLGQLDGSTCRVVRWHSLLDGSERRETVWLDDDRGLALRKYEADIRHPQSGEWATVERWTTAEIVACRAADRFDYWYPTRTEQLTLTPDGEEVLTNVVTVELLRINDVLDPAAFTPEIEDGTSVVNHLTGETYPYGGGASPRLRRLVDRRIEESKRRLAGVEVEDDLEGRTIDPRRWSTLFTWAALACGVIALVAAISLRLGRNVRHSS